MPHSRLSVVVRDAEPEDASALIDLWGRCVEDLGPEAGDDGTSVWRVPVVAEAADAIAATAEAAERRMIVGIVEGDLVGVIVVTRRTITPIHTTQVLVVSDLHVDPRFRRKCVASTLMSAAVRWAEECDCEVVFTTAPSVSKDSHRFLARLGFGHVATVRAARTSALRSRFAGIATSSRDTGRLIAVRRTLRRRETISGQVGRGT